MPVASFLFWHYTSFLIALCCLSCQLNLSLILSAVTLFIPNSGISKAVKVFMGVQMRDSQSKVNL